MNGKLLRDLTRKERRAYQRLCVARNDLEVLSDAIAVLLDPPAIMAGRPRARRSRLSPLSSQRKEK
jgi:hypothetical protein